MEVKRLLKWVVAANKAYLDATERKVLGFNLLASINYTAPKEAAAFEGDFAYKLALNYTPQQLEELEKQLEKLDASIEDKPPVATKFKDCKGIDINEGDTVNSNKPDSLFKKCFPFYKKGLKIVVSEKQLCIKRINNTRGYWTPDPLTKEFIKENHIVVIKKG